MGYSYLDAKNLEDEYSNMDASSVGSEDAAGDGAGAAGGGLAAAGLASGNPYLAAASIGGSFITNYMAAKAKEESDRRNRQMQIEQGYGNDQNQAFSNTLAGYAKALR